MRHVDGEPVTTLLLVRHAATAHTAQGRYSGCTGADPELSGLGRRQAAALAAALSRSHPVGTPSAVTAVVTSPMRRCRQSAEAVAGVLGLAPEHEDDLREIDFGDWEGRTGGEVRRGWPDELAAWQAGATAAPVGGEPLHRVAGRVRRVRERLAAQHPGGTVVLVSHLYPVRLSVLEAVQAPETAVHRMLHGPTAVSEIRVQAGLATLVRHNDGTHLRDLPPG